MGKHKKKIVVDKEASDFKSKHGRIPTARPSQTFMDKSKYTRKTKYKNSSKDLERGKRSLHLN